MYSKESMEVEEMVVVGILVPPDEEEEEGYLAFRRYYEWNKKGGP